MDAGRAVNSGPVESELQFGGERLVGEEVVAIFTDTDMPSDWLALLIGRLDFHRVGGQMVATPEAPTSGVPTRATIPQRRSRPWRVVARRRLRLTRNAI